MRWKPLPPIQHVSLPRLLAPSLCFLTGKDYTQWLSCSLITYLESPQPDPAGASLHPCDDEASSSSQHLSPLLLLPLNFPVLGPHAEILYWALRCASFNRRSYHHHHIAWGAFLAAQPISLSLAPTDSEDVRGDEVFTASAAHIQHQAVKF